MKGKQAELVSIDRHIFEELKMNGASIQGVYTSTIHLSLSDSIITLGHAIGLGKHHVIMDQNVSFMDADIAPGLRVTIQNDEMLIGSNRVVIKPEAIRSFRPYVQTFRLDLKSIDVMKALKTMIMDSKQFQAFASKDASPHVRYQYEKIDIFLNSPGYPSALSILGLGMGLTPLGDDILTGFIMGLNTVGKTLPWIQLLIQEAPRKTSRLSAQNLKDTWERYYPDLFIELIEGIMIHHDIKKALPVLNLGATSGAGILYGFIHGIL
jgi:hypothetical protein